MHTNDSKPPPNAGKKEAGTLGVITMGGAKQAAKALQEQIPAFTVTVADLQTRRPVKDVTVSKTPLDNEERAK